MEKKLIIVRGGGDLATGTIHRLWSAGFPILVLETENPAAIRRQVAVSEAIYDGKTVIEGMSGIHIEHCDQAQDIIARGAVPVLVDPKGTSIQKLHPAVVVDATLAKKNLGMKKENIRLRDHSPEELVFYSKATTDIEFAFPFGWGELWGIADRTDYDLTQHMNHSKQDLSYQDPETNEKYVPYVIEPSLGADRVVLAFLCNSYEQETLEDGDTRVVLHLHPALAPYKVAVLPLSKKLSDKAMEVYTKLSKKFMCDYDETGSIGKRYRREDEIGTPYCVTIDFDTLEDDTVTIRDRDTMEQIRLKIDEIPMWLEEKIEF